MSIQQNVPLKRFNTLGVESYAEYMAQVTSIEQFKEVAEFARLSGLKIKVLGGGSNVVMSEAVSGVVVQYKSAQIALLSDDNAQVLIRVDAGFNWHDLVMHSLKQGWYGLENLAFIPGLVGAAPVQNIGAYGVEVKDCIQHVHGVFIDSLEEFHFTAEECGFEYRESIFKQALEGNVLITAVDFKLSKLPTVNVSYAPLDQMAKEKGVPTPLELAHWVIDVRKSKLPQPDQLPNAGSFFKNPVITLEVFEGLVSRYPAMPHYKLDEGVKVPAGWLIDQLGFKGKSFGPVSVHKQQALVLVNHGGKGVDVLHAADEVKQAVLDHYGIQLEQEPRLFA